jgi:butyrate kinase
MVDLNNANEFGPFSPERAGGLPAGDLARLCFNGRYTMEELRKRLVGNGGLKAYIGTSDMREVSSRVDSGDEKAAWSQAMALQISKESHPSRQPFRKGRCSDPHGGIAHDVSFVGSSPPGSVDSTCSGLSGRGRDEGPCQGALRVLSGQEEAWSTGTAF